MNKTQQNNDRAMLEMAAEHLKAAARLLDGVSAELKSREGCEGVAKAEELTGRAAFQLNTLF